MSYNTLFKEATEYFDQGNFLEAEGRLRRILETAPSQPDVLNLLGLVAQAKWVHAEACSYFSAAIREKDTEPAFFYNLAFSLKALQQYAEALHNFGKVLQMAPHIKEAHNEMACIYEITGQLEKARQHWHAALNMDASYVTAAINLAYSYRIDNEVKAEADLLMIAQQYPEEALVWYDLACMTYDKQKFAQAIDFAEKADRLIVSDAVKCLKGQINLASQKIDEALVLFEQAEQLNDNNFSAKLYAADILSSKGFFEEAEKRYKRLLELDAKDFAAHHNYAEMLYRQNRLSEALEEYRQAVIIAPYSAEVNNNLGVVLKDMKDYRQALGLFFNALKLDNKMDAVSVNIAETLILMSDSDEDEARQIADRWAKQYPDNPFAKHIDAALRGDNDENNQIYTEKLFDNFADHYEMVMQNLDYSAPMAIGRIAGLMEGRVVDLGCGSGLVGAAVKTDKNQIIGVDLSAVMLEQAALKGIYCELVKSDIFDFLRSRKDYDWIVAGDVLGYIGALDDFFALCKGKNLVFTIEKLENGNDYQIFAQGRFKHAPEYIERLLLQNGFCDIFKENLDLRLENGFPVKGCLFRVLWR